MKVAASNKVWYGLNKTRHLSHMSLILIHWREKLTLQTIHHDISWPAIWTYLNRSKFSHLVGGLEYVLCSHILGRVIPIDFHIFQRGRLNHQPDMESKHLDPARSLASTGCAKFRTASDGHRLSRSGESHWRSQLRSIGMVYSARSSVLLAQRIQEINTNIPTAMIDTVLLITLLMIFDVFSSPKCNLSELSIHSILCLSSFACRFLCRISEAKTYEAHCDLSLQLAAGQLERDYAVLAHGWAVDRKISAQLYWRCSTMRHIYPTQENVDTWIYIYIYIHICIYICIYIYINISHHYPCLVFATVIEAYDCILLYRITQCIYCM